MCVMVVCVVFKQKTAYEMRSSDWSSDVCSSDLDRFLGGLDQRDRARDGDAIAADLVGLAAQAGAKTRRPRRRRIGIESDVLATRMARGAARLAIDAGVSDPDDARTEELGVGVEGVSRLMSRWSP